MFDLSNLPLVGIRQSSIGDMMPSRLPHALCAWPAALGRMRLRCWHRLTLPPLYGPEGAHEGREEAVHFLELRVLLVHQAQSKVRFVQAADDTDGKVTVEVAFHIGSHVLMMLHPPSEHADVAEVKVLCTDTICHEILGHLPATVIDGVEDHPSHEVAFLRVEG